MMHGEAGAPGSDGSCTRGSSSAGPVRRDVVGLDGTIVACWDWGWHPAGPSAPAGAPVVLMAHGTGLNGLAWSPVADECASRGLRCVAMDMRAHGASGRPPTGDLAWERFGEDVLAVVDQLGLQVVVGAGHSAGSSALLLAEASRPGALAGVWAWEPIMAVPGNDLRQLRSPELAERARRRRADFASVDEARRHFAGRGLFAELTAGSLDGYLRGGLRPAPGGGFTLACSPEDEALVYEGGGAHHAWSVLPGLRCPVRLVGGELSPAVPPFELARIHAEVSHAELAVLAGLGHFGPFQQPSLIAQDIVRWASAIGR